ncbi:MAG TPA: hypothetical protein DIS78_06050 [Lachnospiraceae bacterium]|nr:hypothetical protein [Lachnospiraceae bacterium]
MKQGTVPRFKCTDCIHCETAYYQEDKICVPQRFSTSDPRNTRDNIACRFYEEAPRMRERSALGGVIIREVWDEEDGRYIEDRPPLIY